MAEHVYVDREWRSTSAETTMRQPTTFSNSPTNLGIKHCN
jgi:hypothetical protein